MAIARENYPDDEVSEWARLIELRVWAFNDFERLGEGSTSKLLAHPALGAAFARRDELSAFRSAGAGADFGSLAHRGGMGDSRDSAGNPNSKWDAEFGDTEFRPFNPQQTGTGSPFRDEPHWLRDSESDEDSDPGSDENDEDEGEEDATPGGSRPESQFDFWGQSRRVGAPAHSGGQDESDADSESDDSGEQDGEEDEFGDAPQPWRAPEFGQRERSIADRGAARGWGERAERPEHRQRRAFDSAETPAQPAYPSFSEPETPSRPRSRDEKRAMSRPREEDDSRGSWGTREGARENVGSADAQPPSLGDKIRQRAAMSAPASAAPVAVEPRPVMSHWARLVALRSLRMLSQVAKGWGQKPPPGRDAFDPFSGAGGMGRAEAMAQRSEKTRGKR